MKRQKNVQMTITQEEYTRLMWKIRDKEDEVGCRLTMSSYLRDFVLIPHLEDEPSPSN